MSDYIKIITNENNNSFISNLNEDLSKSKFFDCMVGYFFISGFEKINKELTDITRIRILIGMGTNELTFNILDKFNHFSNIKIEDKIISNLKKELIDTNTSKKFETSVNYFYKYLNEGKIIIKAYPERKLHSKMYLVSQNENEGNVYIGSSNLTRGGLENNIELNIRLNDKNEYNSCKDLFEKYWCEGVDLTKEYKEILSESYILNELSSEELYYKFLYEYFGSRIDWDKDNNNIYIPDENFERLTYQIDAVIQAKSIVEKYNGVFLADVVGLGKTYMGAMLLQQLKGKSLVIVPPQLMQHNNPGSWRYILNKFNVDADIESSGNLKNVVMEKNLNLYKNVLIDEAHEFRNEKTKKYGFLHEICQNKKVILVSATPFNNNILDVVNLIKLFQPAHNSSLPNSKVKDIEGYFNKLNKDIIKSDDDNKYKNIKETSEKIKKDVLKYLMVRRTRNDIDNYYKEDSNKIKIPKCKTPEKVSYVFTKKIDELFDETLDIITNKITYARYTPYSDNYYNGKKSKKDHTQNNIRSFIKIFLFKRLESNIQSFTKTLSSFIKRHEKILEIYDKNNYFIINKGKTNTYEKLEKDTYDIENLNDIDDNYKIETSNFNEKFKMDIQNDLDNFKNLYDKWDEIKENPKINKLLDKVNTIIKKPNDKLVIFTEFIDTANYLKERLEKDYKVLVYTGKSSKEEQNKVIKNFDQNIEEQENEYQILISTDVLSHGVNLHRSHHLINYDIPWNPTKIMQRVGRIQRVQTKGHEKKINIYNFLPNSKVEKNTNIEKYATDKIDNFVSLLGSDTKIFDEDITTNEFFERLNANPDELDENTDNSDEMEYLKEIRKLRDENSNKYEKIKKIACKSRVSIKNSNEKTITLFKVNNTPRIILTDLKDTKEIDFLTAVKDFENYKKETQASISEKYYDNVNKNNEKLREILYRDYPLNLSRPEQITLKKIEYLIYNKEKLDKEKFEYLIKLRKMLKLGLISHKCIEINKIKKYNNIQKLYNEIIKIIPEKEIKYMNLPQTEKNYKIIEVLNKEFRG